MQKYCFWNSRIMTEKFDINKVGMFNNEPLSVLFLFSRKFFCKHIFVFNQVF